MSKPTASRPSFKDRFVIPVLIALFGLAAIGYGGYQIQDIHRLQQVGHRATADAPASYVDHRRMGIHMHYDADIGFRTEDGREVRKHHDFPEAAMAAWRSGRPAPLRYDPQDPEDFQFEDTGILDDCAFVAFGVLMLASLVVGRLRARRR